MMIRKHARSLLRRIALLGGACAASLPAGAAGPSVAELSQTDFGGVGLMQNPTARFAEEGTLSFGVSHAKPYGNLYFSLQLLPWMETTIRYTRISNRDYAAGFDQSYKDKGFDFKIRLLEESRYFPEFALGIRDVGGTGIFGSEYVVANKAFGDFDFSLGIGWGRLGARGDFDNPLASIDDSFESRGSSSPGGGSPDFDRWFAGEEVAVFGGVEWRTPIRRLRLKLEYEGNDYESEALANNQDQDSPVNAALVYGLTEGIDLTLGYERGNTFMAHINASVNFQKEKGPPKFFDPQPTPLKVRQIDDLAATISREDERRFVKALEDGLAAQKFTLHAVDLNRDAHAVKVWYSQGLFRNPARADGRVARALTATAPDGIETFTMISVADGLETHRTTLARRDLEAAAGYSAGPEDLWESASVTEPMTGYRRADFNDVGSLPDFTWEFAPALRQHIGGADDFYFYQLWVKATGNLQLTPEFSITGTVGANVHNNFDGLTSRPDSNLPHVRSEIANYLKEGENNLVQLEANYLWSPAPQWYARFSAGIFEEMYGGSAAELLYRPYDKPWAVSVDVNRVRQRTFEQRFDFFDYQVTTGHLTLFYDLPWYDIHARISAGRYLAGDEGMTFDFSRTFASGVRAGAFATFTNVSASEFGEGRFDKGFYLLIPFDMFFTNSSRQVSSIVFKPLTRDGGQKVDDGKPLYPIVEGSGYSSVADGWPQVLD